jgi:hypothetical protein
VDEMKQYVSISVLFENDDFAQHDDVTDMKF